MADRYAHYVAGRDALRAAPVLGTPVTSLCGKRWVPGQDPEKFPVCPVCAAKVPAGGWAA